MVFRYLKFDTKECKPCFKDCLTCSGSKNTDCLSCLEGYNLNQQTGECKSIKCVENCISCSGTSENDCEKCKNGFYLDRGFCKICDVRCKECFGTSKNCTNCNSNEIILKNKCFLKSNSG